MDQGKNNEKGRTLNTGRKCGLIMVMVVRDITKCLPIGLLIFSFGWTPQSG